MIWTPAESQYIPPAHLQQLCRTYPATQLRTEAHLPQTYTASTFKELTLRRQGRPDAGRLCSSPAIIRRGPEVRPVLPEDGQPRRVAPLGAAALRRGLCGRVRQRRALVAAHPPQAALEPILQAREARQQACWQAVGAFGGALAVHTENSTMTAHRTAVWRSRLLLFFSTLLVICCIASTRTQRGVVR